MESGDLLNMNFILLALLFIVAKGTKDAKILGGRFAKKGEFPFVVALVDKDGLHCGGALVTLYSVLTAGHCVVVEAWPFGKMISTRYTVIGGSLKYDIDSNEIGIQQRHVSSVQVHPGYRSKINGGVYNDIAIVYLLASFAESPSLTTMKLFSKDKADFKKAWEGHVVSGITCIGVGWGYTQRINGSKKKRPFSNLSPDLKIVSLKPESNQYCRPYTTGKSDEDTTDKGEVCLSPLVNGAGVCYGDSGGPLICEGFVFGLLSAVFKECANIEYPAKYLLLWPYIEYYYLGEVKSFSISIVKERFIYTILFLHYIQNKT